MATKLQMLGDIDMNAKDIHDAGVKLGTYIYDESLSPATQYYWYRILPPEHGNERDRYLISICGDTNYSWQCGTYILDISRFGDDTYCVTLMNLGMTAPDGAIYQHLLAVGIDHHGEVYVQTCPAWALNQLRISRIMTWGAYNTGVTQPYQSVGHSAFGVAAGFDALKIILDSGSARVLNGSLDTDSGRLSRVMQYSEGFAMYGGGNTFTFSVSPTNGRGQLNRGSSSVVEFQDDKMITGCDLVNRWQNNLGNSAFPWGTVTAKQLVLGWTTLDETALQKLLAGGGGSSLGHTLRIAYADNNYDIMLVKGDGSIEYRTIENGGSAKITDVYAVYCNGPDPIPVYLDAGLAFDHSPYGGSSLLMSGSNSTIYDAEFMELKTDVQVYFQI